MIPVNSDKSHIYTINPRAINEKILQSKTLCKNQDEIVFKVEHRKLRKVKQLNDIQGKQKNKINKLPDINPSLPIVTTR